MHTRLSAYPGESWFTHAARHVIEGDEYDLHEAMERIDYGFSDLAMRFLQMFGSTVAWNDPFNSAENRANRAYAYLLADAMYKTGDL